jgi:NitT/TauT family transport system substrate-binding protein
VRTRPAQRTRTALIGLLAASLGSLALTACGSGSSGGSTAITMGIEPWVGYAPWYIAQEKGFFAKHGLSVSIVNFQQDTDRNSALIAGKTDVSNIDTGRTIQFAAKNLPGRPILLEDASVGADAILADPSVSSAAQLQGQKVAYESGTTSDLLLHYYLLQNKIPFSAVTSINVPAANAGALLIAGKDKVTVTYQPYIGEATSGANGIKAHVLYSSAGAPGLIGDFLVANKTWLAGHAADAKKLLAAWSDAIAYYDSHRADAVAIMAKGIGSKPADLAPTLSGVKLYSVADNTALVSSGELAKTYLSVGETLKAMGVINKAVPLASAADLSYVK